MEELSLLKDFAVIMVVAGAVTLLFRRLRQPIILGYLIAGVLIGPYTFSSPPVTDVHTISMLADLGLILLLFAIGLEFSWGKIRQVGWSVLLIGGIEITIMISIGYGLGRLMGWSTIDSIFLGSALHISSSAIIMKILSDTGKLKALSSRLIIGILVVEDFAAITIIALLSGIATTGAADIGDIGALTLRLFIFIVASLVFGAIIVPKIIRFTRRFNSKEALLITSLGLCFAMALISESLGLSVAAGAFLMGALIGDTKHSEEIADTISPVRDMFAALFFVTIGMLINVAQFKDFIIPGIIISCVFIAGKILSNSMATFISGHDGKTSLQVGMAMPQMGEFSLVITKIGIDRGVVLSPLYPIVTLVTAITSLTTPYIARSADSVSNFLEHKSPGLLKVYVSRLADWLQALRATFARDSVAALVVQHAIKIIIINLLIIVVIIGIGTFSLRFVDDLALISNIRADVIGLLISFLLLMLCLPFFIVVWRNIRNLVDESVAHVLIRRLSAKKWRREAVRAILRDSIVISLTVLVGIWFIPFIISLLNIGSFALAMPVLLLALVIYLILRFVFDIHGQLEQSFRQTILGEKYTSTSDLTTTPGTRRRIMATFTRIVKLPVSKAYRHRHVTKNTDAEPVQDSREK